MFPNQPPPPTPSLLSSQRQKLHNLHRSKQRQQAILLKRLQNLLPNDVTPLIPQYIHQSNIQSLQQLYQILISGCHPRLVLQFPKEYFIEEFEKGKDIKLKVVILKLHKYINGWEEEEWELAFGVCESEGMLEGMMEWMNQRKVVGERERKEGEEWRKEIKGRFPFVCMSIQEKLSKLLKLFQSRQYSSKSQLIYSYLILFYSPPPFQPSIISRIFSLIDNQLSSLSLPSPNTSSPQLYNILFLLDYFLSFSCNFSLYPQILHLKNFPLIIEQCFNPQISYHTLAFEICIDIIYDNQMVINELFEKYQFVEILERFVKNPLLAIRAMWAISNIVMFPEFINRCLPLISNILQTQHTTNKHQFDSTIIFQLKNIIINLLYSLQQQHSHRIILLWDLIVGHVKDVLEWDVYSRRVRKEGKGGDMMREMRKNMVMALGRFLETGVEVRRVYLRYGIDRCLEGELKETGDKGVSGVIEEMLEYLKERDEERDEESDSIVKVDSKQNEQESSNIVYH